LNIKEIHLSNFYKAIKNRADLKRIEKFWINANELEGQQTPIGIDFTHSIPILFLQSPNSPIIPIKSHHFIWIPLHSIPFNWGGSGLLAIPQIPILGILHFPFPSKSQ
jgi:hypothetical protein